MNIKSTLPTTDSAPANYFTTTGKTYPAYNKSLAEDYKGVREMIHSENDIIESYESARQFFKDAENRHQKAATWYFDQSREFEAKAGRHLDLAEKAYQQAYDYLELLAMTTLKRLGKSEEVQRVA